MRHRPFIAAALAIGGLATIGGVVHADRDYRTYHAPLQPIDDAPLRSGFVNNIHMEGPVAYAKEYYDIKGAEPDSTYYAVIELYFGTPDCSANGPIEPPGPDDGFPGILSAVLETNKAGNAHAASILFSPADVEGLTDNTHGVNWVIYDDSRTAVYESGCSEDYLDPVD
jgi:hypothetical protein